MASLGGRLLHHGIEGGLGFSLVARKSRPATATEARDSLTNPPLVTPAPRGKLGRIAAFAPVPFVATTALSAFTISCAALGEITCRTAIGSLCATTVPLRSTNFEITIGFINSPSFAIADIAINVCRGVAEIP